MENERERHELGTIDGEMVYGLCSHPGDGHHDEEHTCWVIVDASGCLMSDFLGASFEDLFDEADTL